MIDSQPLARLPWTGQFPTIDSFVMFLNLYKCLIYLSQINRTLFIQFWRMHTKGLQLGIKSDFSYNQHTYI